MGRVHAQDESADLRELDAGGGWYRTENDLQLIFEPLVGYKACWLYTVLCRLVPLAQKRLAEGTRLDLTHQFLAKQSGLSKSTVQREIEPLVKVGMVRRIERSMKRCPTYQLVNLQRLAALGTAALKARLGDPDRVSTEEADDAGLTVQAMSDGDQGRAAADVCDDADSSDPQERVEAPAQPSPSGDPYRVSGEGDEKKLDCTASGSPVTLILGVGDPPAGLLIKHKDIRQKDSPVVPVPGTVADPDGPVLSFIDCRHGDPKFEVNLRDAARWVMEQDGITAGVSQTRRLEGTIAEALRLEAKQSRRDLVELARLAAANWVEYRSTKGKFALKIENFMAQMVFKRDKWGVRPKARPSVAKDSGPLYTQERISAYLLRSAETIEKAGIAPAVAVELRQIAAELPPGEYEWPTVVALNNRMAELEEKLHEGVMASTPAAKLEVVRKQVVGETSQAVRVNPELLERARKRKIGNYLARLAGLPDLDVVEMKT